MEIAPKFTDAQWRALDLTTEAGWTTAIEVFQRRIEDRFLGPAGGILRSGRYTGFAALAIDCLLVETLQQFKEGLNETLGGDAQRLFEAFLTGGVFAGIFTPQTAQLFRKTIRNGILHMGQVGGTSLVRRGKTDPLVTLTPTGDGVVINAVLFHEQMVAALVDYVGALRQPGSELRPNFRTKMEYIAGKNSSA